MSTDTLERELRATLHAVADSTEARDRWAEITRTFPAKEQPKRRRSPAVVFAAAFATVVAVVAVMAGANYLMGRLGPAAGDVAGGGSAPAPVGDLRFPVANHTPDGVEDVWGFLAVPDGGSGPFPVVTMQWAEDAPVATRAGLAAGEVLQLDIQVSLGSPGDVLGDHPPAQEFELRGVLAYLVAGSGYTLVVWEAAPGVTVQVSAPAAIPTQDVLAVAEGVELTTEAHWRDLYGVDDQQMVRRAAATRSIATTGHGPVVGTAPPTTRAVPGSQAPQVSTTTLPPPAPVGGVATTALPDP